MRTECFSTVDQLYSEKQELPLPVIVGLTQAMAFRNVRGRTMIIKDSGLIWDTLHDIKTNLVKNSSDVVYTGLMGGDAGILLFLYYYYKARPDSRLLDRIFELLNKIFDSIEYSENTILSFANGLCGVAWVINHISADGIIGINSNEILGDTDSILHDHMITEMRKGNYDYLHGGGGMGLYFSGRQSSEHRSYHTSQFFKELTATAVSVSGNRGIAWYDCDEADSERRFNLGLSHGLPGIIMLLLKSTEGSNTEQTHPYVCGSVQFMLQQKNNSENSLSLFPWDVKELTDGSTFHETRLAWCYGDLGIGFSILAAGLSLNNQYFTTEGVEILRHTTKRRHLSDNTVVDAGLCHGTAGIAHIYHRVYKLTQNDTFKMAADHWLKETIHMRRYSNEESAGFKSWNGAAKSMENDYGFLTGIAGIGLALLGFVTEMEPRWHECLLLR